MLFRILAESLLVLDNLGHGEGGQVLCVSTIHYLPRHHGLGEGVGISGDGDVQVWTAGKLP